MKKIIFVLFGSMFFASMAFGGDPYNGPTTKGSSIPLSIDKDDFSLDDLESSYETCMIKVFKEINSQMPSQEQSNSPECLVDSQPLNKEERSAQMPTTLTISCWASPSGNRMLMKTEYWSLLRNKGMELRTDYSITDTDSEGFTLSVKTFPYLRFIATETCSGYDEYGNPIKPTISYSNLSLVLPSNYGKSVPLINETTHRESKVRVNMVAFKDCMSTLIQN